MTDNLPAQKEQIPFHSKPDFVVVGGQSEAGVILMASKELTDVELTSILINEERCLKYGEPPDYRVYLVTKMKEDYVVIHAPNYPIAWQELFNCWDPNHYEPRMAQVTKRRRAYPQRQLPQ